MADSYVTRVYQAAHCLKSGDRDGAATLLAEELRVEAHEGARWREAASLAMQIGEIEIAIEAARRSAQADPSRLDLTLYYLHTLASFDRTEAARREAAQLPATRQDHPGVQLLLGSIAAGEGDFDRAQDCIRRAVPTAPLLAWANLAGIKTFEPGDPDLAAMEQLVPQLGTAPPPMRARFLYAVAKAYHDCGEFDRAWDLYEAGAKIRKRLEPWDPKPHRENAEAIMRDFSAEAMERLTPPEKPHRRALFVTGTPRSGTTLVKQMLVSHSQIEDGAEVGLLSAALIPTIDFSFAGALAYQDRFGSGDPWGKLAADYFRMLQMRFRTESLTVDKTTTQSYFMGLLMHMLPGARVIWLRRNPDDVALSYFRTYLTTPHPPSWSLKDIARFLSVEDRLFAHWTALFPDRILAVPYEGLVGDPKSWAARIVEFAGLAMEPQVLEFDQVDRKVRTASVLQARSPISRASVGAAKAYARHMEPFRRAYYR